MTTREKIEKEINNYYKMNKLNKLIWFIGMSIIFGITILLYQMISYTETSKGGSDYILVQNTTVTTFDQFMYSISEDISEWISIKYAYLDSISSVLSISVFIISSLLISMVIVYFMTIIMFGSNDRWYYDEFKNSKGDGIIEGLKIVSNIEDLGQTYKFKVSRYDLIGIYWLEEFEVEKWKVTNKVNIWKLW